MPNFCARLNVTHVLLSPAVQNRKGFEKLITILSVWYPLIDIASDPSSQGHRYALEPHPSGQRGLGRLIPKAIPPELLESGETPG